MTINGFVFTSITCLVLPLPSLVVDKKFAESLARGVAWVFAWALSGITLAAVLPCHCGLCPRHCAVENPPVLTPALNTSLTRLILAFVPTHTSALVTLSIQGLYSALGLRGAAAVTVFTNAMMLVNASSPAGQLGEVNGVGQVSSGSRNVYRRSRLWLLPWFPS